jgi:hypothetical protein
MSLRNLADPVTFVRSPILMNAVAALLLLLLVVTRLLHDGHKRQGRIGDKPEARPPTRRGA